MFTTFNNAEYETIMELGRGAYGTVFLVVHSETRKVYAMKKLKNRNEGFALAQKEINMFSKIGEHPNLISLKGIEITKNHTHLYMDYVRGEDLFDFFEEKRATIDLNMIIGYFKQLLCAVKHMHDNGISHRDIKPENILITKNGTIKLIDYGMSSTERITGGFYGTIEFMSPEIIENPYKKYDTYKADVWACGMVLYEMIYGMMENGSRSSIIKFICASEISIPDVSSFPVNTKDFVSFILKKDPTKRPSIDELIKHPFLN